MPAIPPKTSSFGIAGVMGWPIGHSRSPQLHGYWLRRYGVDGAYMPMAVRPERLAEAIRALPALGFRGANLTIPHKEAAIACGAVDFLDDDARRIGAVNTLVVHDDGRVEGRNTDAFGFRENLMQAGADIKGGVAVMLGAGGAARAVAYALAGMGCAEVRIVNRNRDKALKLAADFGRNFTVRGWDEVSAAMDGAGLLVNATSLGMTGQAPLEMELSGLPQDAWVTDLVYSPLETRLLARARERGNRVVDGLGMLLHQARPGFAAWFGVEPEVTSELREHMLAQA